MLPVEAHMTTRAPSATALVIAAVIPRSLNDPVGFAPSSLRRISARTPSRRARAGAATRGVPPSSNVTMGAPAPNGMNSLYSSMIPLQSLKDEHSQQQIASCSYLNRFRPRPYILLAGSLTPCQTRFSLKTCAGPLSTPAGTFWRGHAHCVSCSVNGQDSDPSQRCG